MGFYLHDFVKGWRKYSRFARDANLKSNIIIIHMNFINYNLMWFVD